MIQFIAILTLTISIIGLIYVNIHLAVLSYRDSQARKRLNEKSMSLSNPFEEDDSWRFEDPHCVESEVFTDKELESLNSYKAKRANKLVQEYFNELPRSQS